MPVIAGFSSVKNFAVYSWAYVFGTALALFIVISVSFNSARVLIGQGVADSAISADFGGFFPMMGVAIMFFEGIGAVMPVLHKTGNKEEYKTVLASTMITLTFLSAVYAESAYLAFGANTTTIVTEVLPVNFFTVSIRLLNVINLIFSYVIVAVPINNVVEEWLKIEDSQWSIASRFLICAFCATLAIAFAEQIDLIIGLIGAVLCAPIALYYPAAMHLRSLAKT